MEKKKNGQASVVCEVKESKLTVLAETFLPGIASTVWQMGEQKMLFDAARRAFEQ
jgi:hypothetical protein